MKKKYHNIFVDFCTCSSRDLYYSAYVTSISVTSIKKVNQKKSIPAGLRVINYESMMF